MGGSILGLFSPVDSRGSRVCSRSHRGRSPERRHPHPRGFFPWPQYNAAILPSYSEWTSRFSGGQFCFDRGRVRFLVQMPTTWILTFVFPPSPAKKSWWSTWKCNMIASFHICCNAPFTILISVGAIQLFETWRYKWDKLQELCIKYR
jgi:hypothetical protein